MKAISPVIATVIIVAVAIAISIAVALWITGLTSAFTGVEKLEIVNAYATKLDTGGWNVTIIIRNSGTKPATVDNIFINNKPGNTNYAYTKPNDEGPIGAGLTINPGETKTIYFYLETGGNDIVDDTFISGQTISIVIHTASGGQYPATVTLP